MKAKYLIFSMDLSEMELHVLEMELDVLFDLDFKRFMSEGKSKFSIGYYWLASVRDLKELIFEAKRGNTVLLSYTLSMVILKLGLTRELINTNTVKEAKKGAAIINRSITRLERILAKKMEENQNGE